MRNLKAKDIFQNTNTTINEEIEKKQKKFDEEQLNNNAIKFLKDNYYMLLSTESGNINYLFRPSKRYEIFNLDVFGGKTFLVDATILPEGDNRDLYYSFEIANQIYQKNIDIQDSSCNEYEEVKTIYEREILQVESEISDLKKMDNELFDKDLNIYDLISQTPLYENYQLLNKDKEYLMEKNEKLNQTIVEYNEKIRNLSQKLKVTMEKVEELQKPKSFFEKFKDLFKDDRKKLLIDDRKGE